VLAKTRQRSADPSYGHCNVNGYFLYPVVGCRILHNQGVVVSTRNLLRYCSILNGVSMTPLYLSFRSGG
jgi:hypothetical protein